MSLAFLLRNAAARLLDVGPDELVTEISPKKLDETTVVGEVFLADRLENGAGYATWMTQHLDELLVAAKAESARHLDHSGSGCDGSCYDCLRDYSNSAYHPLLDWFLAGEALSLLTGGGLDLDGDPWEAAVAAYGTAFGWSLARDLPGARVLTSDRDGRGLLVAHPLLRAQPAARMLVEALTGAGLEEAHLTTGYEIARRPGLVEGRARSGLLPKIGIP